MISIKSGSNQISIKGLSYSQVVDYLASLDKSKFFIHPVYGRCFVFSVRAYCYYPGMRSRYSVDLIKVGK